MNPFLVMQVAGLTAARTRFWFGLFEADGCVEALIARLDSPQEQKDSSPRTSLKQTIRTLRIYSLSMWRLGMILSVMTQTAHHAHHRRPSRAEEANHQNRRKRQKDYVENGCVVPANGPLDNLSLSFLGGSDAISEKQIPPQAAPSRH